MSIFTTKCIILSTLLVAMRSELLTHAQQLPCFFIFGDSLYDNGNNNNIITLANVDYLPYGIDFFQGPSGRFTNGFNIADFFAQRIGFTSLIPPWAAAKDSEFFYRGLNYASGTAGILDSTSIQVLGRFPMNLQLDNHKRTVSKAGTLLGNQTAANNYLRQCLYTVSMGGNDIINNYYYLPITVTRLSFSPESFVERLIRQYTKQLTTLYNLQARKVAIVGLAPLGCLPQLLSLFQVDPATGCAEVINDAAKMFNTKLISLVSALNANLPGAKFTYLNLYNYLSGNFSTALGIKVTNAPCCEINILTGSCIPNGNVCSNRDEYTYLDNFHPTQIVYRYAADRAFVSQSPMDAIPVDVQTLIQQ